MESDEMAVAKVEFSLFLLEGHLIDFKNEILTIYYINAFLLIKRMKIKVLRH